MRRLRRLPGFELFMLASKLLSQRRHVQYSRPWSASPGGLPRRIPERRPSWSTPSLVFEPRRVYSCMYHARDYPLFSGVGYRTSSAFLDSVPLSLDGLPRRLAFAVGQSVKAPSVLHRIRFWVLRRRLLVRQPTKEPPGNKQETNEPESDDSASGPVRESNVLPLEVGWVRLSPARYKPPLQTAVTASRSARGAG